MSAMDRKKTFGLDGRNGWKAGLTSRGHNHAVSVRTRQLTLFAIGCFIVPLPAYACRVGHDQHLFEEAPPANVLPRAENGVVLLGLALDMNRDAASPSVPDPKAGLYLPSFAATAWYHNKIDRSGRSLQQLHDEVSAFAVREYPEALFRSSKGLLSDAEKQRLAAKVASYTGVSSQVWLQNGLRLSSRVFLRTILADKGLEAGAYDSRYTLPLALSGNDPVADDPAMGRYVPGFIAAFHQILREDLKVSMPVPYSAITWTGLNFDWNWKRTGVSSTKNAAVDLAIAMRRNPDMQVLAASGYYDLVTTPAAGKDEIIRGGLPLERVTFRNYRSGHMLYLGDTSAQFAQDVRALIIAPRKTPEPVTPPRSQDIGNQRLAPSQH